MKLKLFFVLALAAVVCLPANAQKKAKKTKAKTATTAVETPAAPSIKPVDGKTFSEALGIAQSESLKQYLTSRENIDAAHLAEAMKGMTAEISDEERAKALAYAAGLRIAQINKQSHKKASRPPQTKRTVPLVGDGWIFWDFLGD